MCKEGVYAYAFQTGKSGFISPLRLPFVHCIFGRIGAWIPFRILVPGIRVCLAKDTCRICCEVGPARMVAKET